MAATSGWARAEAIAAGLAALSDPERAAGSKRYLKSELDFLGVSTPPFRKLVRGALKSPPLDRRELLAVVEALWVRPVFELRAAAAEALDFRGTLLEQEDMALLERFIRESRTWALVDGLAATVAGRLVVRFPGLGDTLDRWAHDDDFWVRRSALLALLVPLRRGGGDFDRFACYADAMLEEKEFFIRKAIGWVLREVGKKRPELVDRWLEPRLGRAAGLTVREAVKYLPPRRRDVLLAAYKARRA